MQLHLQQEGGSPDDFDTPHKHMVCVVVIGARRQSGCDDWTRGQIVSKNLNSTDKHNDTMLVVKTEAKGNR